MQVQPYLFFDGRCEEAIEFYRRAVGAQVDMLMRYRESPASPPPGMNAGYENKVMHSSFRIGDTTIMASDDCMGHPSFQGFSLAVTVDTPAEAEKKFAALGSGGKVTMPLTQTFFSPSYGMLVDRFGVHWMVMARGT
jgi:PhnB protein